MLGPDRLNEDSGETAGATDEYVGSDEKVWMVRIQNDGELAPEFIRQPCGDVSSGHWVPFSYVPHLGGRTELAIPSIHKVDDLLRAAQSALVVLRHGL